MPRLLIVDDDAHIAASLRERFAARGYTATVACDGEQALARMRQEQPDVVLLDLQMPKLDGIGVLDKMREEGLESAVIVITAHGSIEKAVQATRAGAHDFLQKPFEPSEVEHRVQLALRQRAMARALSSDLPDFVVTDPKMQAVVELARKAAKSDATVLLLGESGTGKEILARSIHRWSRRAAGPFVAVNAVALSETLLESELFGHEKGAFTGALARKPGKIELAHGGTLFLDEIGDISPTFQAKLLRCLQERTYELVGGTETLTSDVRVIAATNRDLKKSVAEGRFREDLYYRLNVISISPPPLRERRADVRPLAEQFLRQFRPGARLSPEAFELIEGYAWPGNVRELRNAIERAAVLLEGDVLTAGDLPQEILSSQKQSLPPGSFHAQVEEFRRRLVQETLARFGGNQTRAAEALALQRTYLARLIRQMNL